MATITGLTAEAMQAVIDDTIVDADIDGSGHLILTTHDGTTIDAGAIRGSFDAATTSASGIVELATTGETTTGTDAVRATTPAGVAAAIAVLAGTVTSGLAGKQASNANLTALSGLTPAANDFLQYISGNWANITVAQMKTALGFSLLATLAAPALTGVTTAVDLTMSGRQIITPDALTVVSSHVSTNAANGNHFDVAATAAFTLDNPTNAVHGQRLDWAIKQDATGSRVMTLDTKFVFGTDFTSATLTTTASKTDYLGAVYDSVADKFRIVAFVKGYL